MSKKHSQRRREQRRKYGKAAMQDAEFKRRARSSTRKAATLHGEPDVDFDFGRAP